MEKVFFIEKNTHDPLYIQLYNSIINEIKNGHLSGDEKMPSIRELSNNMGISRTTIENTYAQLVSEGYIYSLPQKGYYVTPMKIAAFYQQEDKIDALEIQKYLKEMTYPYDFTGEYVEYDNFDMMLWKKNINRALNDDAIELYHMGQPFGENQLKKQICEYFKRVRGINAQESQIIIGSGMQGLLGPLSRLFMHRGYQTLAIENPGFNIAKDVFFQANYSVRPIGLKGKVLDVKQLQNNRRQICFTSPSYQFPYGTIMPMNTRIALLEWADYSDSYIIEDDYNNALRYVGKPIQSLQGMDRHDRVIYMGSFSTLLLPSIRISFMVLPKSLLGDYLKDNYRGTQSASKLEQLALANMLKNDDFGRHIRRLRKNYRSKYLLLKKLLYKHLEAYASIDIDPAGVTCVLKTNKPFDKKLFYSLQKTYEVRTSLLSEFMLKQEEAYEQYIVLNYRGIEASKLEEGVVRIKEVLCRLY